MCTCNEQRPLDYETLLSDPMTRLVMESDGVSIRDLVRVLETARDAIELRVGALRIDPVRLAAR